MYGLSLVKYHLRDFVFEERHIHVQVLMIQLVHYGHLHNV